MKESLKAKRKLDEQIIEQRVDEAFAMLWQVHTNWHWSKIINGHKLCYWPSKKKWRYKGIIETGDVFEFIKKNAIPNDAPIGNANN